MVPNLVKSEDVGNTDEGLNNEGPNKPLGYEMVSNQLLLFVPFNLSAHLFPRKERAERLAF